MKSKLNIILKELRKKSGKTQEEIAKELNISQEAYSNYENGKRTPDIDMIIEIADYYNMPIDILVGRYEKVNYENS